MKKRRILTASALALTALWLTLAGLALRAQEQARPAAGTAQATVQAQGSGTEEAHRYLIRTVDGKVCIFQGEELILETGVSAALLPRQDREALAQGIEVESREELTALLEDLGS